MKSKILSLIVVIAFIVAGCSTAPVTGRKQLMLVSSAQEAQLGLTAFEEAKKETPVSRDPQINEMVQRIGKRIAAVATPDLPDAQWEFVVFESDQPNAFCLPGGKVGIYTGILPITKDENGLATVISHEVAHAAARHGAERMSDAMALQTGGSLVGASLGDTVTPQTLQLFQMAYGVGSQLGMLKFSRNQELEADHVGLIYMARAGYDPESAIGFWQRFSDYAARSSQGRPPAFLSTHPVDSVRIQRIRELLPRARQEFLKSGSAEPSPVISRPRR